MSFKLPVTAEKKITEKAFLALMPSAKLKLALEDLESAEKDKRFEVDMGDWIRFRPNDKSPWTNLCSVCFAGSLLVQRFGRTDFDAMVFGPLRDVAYGIDAIRQNDVWDGIRALMPVNKTIPHDLPEQMPKIISYNQNKSQFKVSIRKLISVLEKHGL